jgi:hypothetical protein
VPVPQTLINLLNLSVPTLQKLAKAVHVEPSHTRARSLDRKWDLVWALAEVPEQTLEAEVGEWLYAGQTSVTWVLLGDGSPVKVDALRNALVAMYGRDPFETDVRPDAVTATPSLVAAKVWTDNKVILTFAVTKRVATVIHNFEPADVVMDEFFLAVLRLDRGVVEVRASHARAQLLVNTWLSNLAQHLD